MEQFIYFAQTPGYNCAGADNSAYGAGNYGTCVTSADGGNTGGSPSTSTGTTQPGAPNTGEFFGFVTGGAFSIILPLVVAIAVVSAATIAVIRKKRATRHS